MSRRFSKLYLLFSLLVMISLVAACAGAAAPAAPAAEAPTAEEAKPTEAPAAEAPAEAAPAEEEKLGASLIGTIEGPEIITDPAQYPTKFGEAPMLADMVKAGSLPPVEERLPKPEDLLVIKPLKEIGKYGGTWHRGFTGPGDGQNGHRVAGGDRFLFWDSDEFPKMTPNLAKSWEVSEDGKEITLHLREGVKWSDGTPFTTEDVLFWYEHMYQNTELVPVQSAFFRVDQGAKLECPDAYTIKFSFPYANSLFLEVLGSSVNVFGGHAINGEYAMGGYAPAHYLKQFHPDFASKDELDAKVKEAGMDTWVNLFKVKNKWQNNPDLPTLTPWKTVNPITTDNWVLERNPYYYGVDSEGNQLPYIDRISMSVAQDLEVLNLKAIAGEFEYQSRHIQLAKLPVLLENAEKGNYTVHLDPAQHGADAGLQINLSYDADPEIAKWLKTTDFRRALSLGIDRDAINEIVFLGIGTPGSAVVAETSPFNPGTEYRSLWATHEVDKANQMLDAIGLDKKDAEGYRLRTDNGERLTLELDPIPAFINFTQVAELIKEDWAEIGIFVNVVETERSLVEQKRNSNQLQIFLWQNDGTDELFLYPYHAIPVDPTSGTGPAFGAWYASGGKAEMSIEPTDPKVKEVLDLFTQGLRATPEERIKIGQEIWKIAIDEVWTIGTVGQSGAFMGVRVVNNDMGNIPSRLFNIQAGQTPNIARPSTFFYQHPDEHK
ncbi:MAG: ABC transporter substrate-binding protein [Caldilineaceae bacterium]